MTRQVLVQVSVSKWVTANLQALPMMMMMMSGMVLQNKLPITEQPWIRLRLSMIFGSWQKNVCMIMMAVVF
jgi:hypothetical protein